MNKKNNQSSKSKQSDKKYLTLKRDSRYNSKRYNEYINKAFRVEIDEEDFNIIQDDTIILPLGDYGLEISFRELFEEHKGIFRFNRKPGYKLKKEYRKYGRKIMASIMTILHHSNNKNRHIKDTVTFKNDLPFWVRSPSDPTRINYNEYKVKNSELRPIKTLTANTKEIELISHSNDNNDTTNPITTIDKQANEYQQYLRNKEVRNTLKNRRTTFSIEKFPPYIPPSKVNHTKPPPKKSSMRGNKRRNIPSKKF